MELDRTVKGSRLGLANLWHTAFAAVPIFFYTFPHQCFYIVKNLCVCVCVCVCVCIYIYIHTHTHTHTHIWLHIDYRCYQIILRFKQFYINRERCEVLTGYLSLWCRNGGDWANTWQWKNICNLLLEQEVVTTPVPSRFSSLSHSSRKPLL